MPEPAQRPRDASARRHQRVRKQHSDELAQDYVEAIDALNRSGSSPRVKDLQRIFGVSHVTVIRALERFERRELIARTPSNGIELTPQGKHMAANAAERHSLVVDFLRILGVSSAQAHADAEGLEHHFSQESLDAIRRFIRRRGGPG